MGRAIVVHVPFHMHNLQMQNGTGWVAGRGRVMAAVGCNDIFYMKM